MIHHSLAYRAESSVSTIDRPKSVATILISNKRSKFVPSRILSRAHGNLESYSNHGYHLSVTKASRYRSYIYRVTCYAHSHTRKAFALSKN